MPTIPLPRNSVRAARVAQLRARWRPLAYGASMTRGKNCIPTGDRRNEPVNALNYGCCSYVIALLKIRTLREYSRGCVGYGAGFQPLNSSITPVHGPLAHAGMLTGLWPSGTLAGVVVAAVWAPTAR